jgi:hypothetical protein
MLVAELKGAYGKAGNITKFPQLLSYYLQKLPPTGVHGLSLSERPDHSAHFVFCKALPTAG